ncbi:alanine racemase [Sphingomonas sp.]|uniref:alanine racemase n=1 Tax=Sphingomonas sp. TaxID=28214 RepID=UPI003D6D672D
MTNNAHAPYFADLQNALRQHGISWPTMVLDRNRMRRNVERLTALIAPTKRLRLVEKSLPVPSMLDELMRLAGTQALMVFHEPQLRQTAYRFPDSDILLGKPMPIQAARHFYLHLGNTHFDPARQLQWLVDTPERLDEYLQLAKGLTVRMRINIEIDVGLHRGGVADPAMLQTMLRTIRAAADHLQFSGLMGYDAHVGKIPSLVESRTTSFNKANQTYTAYKAIARAEFPELAPETRDNICWNGAGSPTVALHNSDESPLNDISAGACLLKGTMFDLDLLADFEPAIFIASPILKAWDGTHLAGPRWLSSLLFGARQSRERTYFTYGGDWRGEICSPSRIVPNKWFGVSYNQAMFSGPRQQALAVDDWLFLRPHQSEGSLLQFGPLQVVEDGMVVDEWLPFTE